MTGGVWPTARTPCKPRDPRPHPRARRRPRHLLRAWPATGTLSAGGAPGGLGCAPPANVRRRVDDVEERGPRLVAAAGRDEHGPVPFDVERLLRLWTDPLPEDDDVA